MARPSRAPGARRGSSRGARLLALTVLLGTAVALVRDTDGVWLPTGAACLVLAASIRRGGPGGAAERRLWRDLSRVATAVGTGLTVAGGCDLAGLDPAAGVYAGSTLGFLLMYRALIGWNRSRTAHGDPGDWLNGLSATGVLVSVGLLVLDLADLSMDSWAPWQTYVWLLQVGLGVVVWGTTLTLVPLSGLGDDSRWQAAVVVTGVLAVAVVASAGWGFAGATDVTAAGWAAAVATLAWCAGLPTTPSRPVTATPHATIIGAFVVFLAGAALLAVDALVQPRDHVVGTLVAAAATATAALRLRHVVDELDTLARTRVEADTDDLTGIANRRGLLRALRAVLEDADSGPVAGLVLVDLDRFKEVNDTFGHAAGDDVLRVVAQRIRAVVGPSSTLGRLGGDEFAVVVADRSDAQVAELTSGLLDVLRTPLDLDGRPVRLGASIGVARVLDADEGTVGVEELLRRADAAMYCVKRRGGGVTVFDPATELAAREVALRVEDLGRALRDDRSGPAHPIVVHYQPQVTVATGEVCGLEALVRWHHPVHGLLSPDLFVDLAETHGLMELLTVHVLEQAVAEAAAWERRGRPVRVSVNLSASCLETPRVADHVARLLAAAGLSPHLLALEITETVLMRDTERTPAVLDALVRCGVGLSVDDFGTGYSSLAYLADLPVDELKIDRSFVRRMLTDARTHAVVAGTVDLAHRLDLRVVAEGVEDRETLEALAALGCDVSQGYLHAPARSSAELAAWLDAREAVGPTPRAAPLA